MKKTNKMHNNSFWKSFDDKLKDIGKSFEGHSNQEDHSNQIVMVFEGQVLVFNSKQEMQEFFDELFKDAVPLEQWCNEKDPIGLIGTTQAKSE